MPVQLDPRITRGTRQLDTILVVMPGTPTPVLSQFRAPSLAVKWVASFLTSFSTGGFTVTLAKGIISPLSVIDVETVGAGGFNNSNFPDFIVNPGEPVAVQVTSAAPQTVTLTLWGHILDL